ncbi:hypothetical protein BDQ12DRAFT_305403 [Crucibulum laeve]|uniref:Uncharacterized protein n=1 Tax=Crucibulum laeve TaxID=68775 RepID=A0A5C3LRA9_9AGAR|nr:hypothetical protein BDQ12DRAFT_305403 [Crucibulum laeve]
MYMLAVEHKFAKDRKSLNVVAVCLYITCRQKETWNYMLTAFRICYKSLSSSWDTLTYSSCKSSIYGCHSSTPRTTPPAR